MENKTFDIMEEIRAQQAQMANEEIDDFDEYEEDDANDLEVEVPGESQEQLTDETVLSKLGPFAHHEASQEAKEFRDRYVIGNASAVKGPHQSCVCYKCQHAFPSKYLMGKGRVEVIDGKKTVLCPYCGRPTVIVTPPGWSYPYGLAHRMWIEFYT